MGIEQPIRVLLVEDKTEFAKLVTLFLERAGQENYDVEWCNNGQDAIKIAESGKKIDVILMDYFLPGLNGLEITRLLRKKNINTPIIFLTVNNDVNLAIEVMKLGVDDYLIKEEVSTPILPKTISATVEKRKLKEEVAELEIRKKRIEAMQEIIVGISKDVTEPLESMRAIINQLSKGEKTEKVSKYLEIIQENVARIELKMEKLRNLEEDKTVKYIKDIKMIDLS